MIWYLNPPGLSTPRLYSHLVSTDSKRLVFVSGQIPVDTQGELVGKGNFEQQVQQVYRNLGIALQSIDAKPSNVLMTNSYVVDYKPVYLDAIRAARRLFFGDAEPSAATLIGVQALALEGIQVEVDAIVALA